MKYTREEIDGDIGDLVPRGLRKDLAASTGVYPSVMYGYFNGDDERKSPWSTTLFLFEKLRQLDDAVGNAVYERFCAFYEAGRPHEFKSAMCVDREMGRLSKEITDIIVAKCDGKPLEVITREIGEARRQLDTFEQAVYQRAGQTMDAVEAVN